MTTRQLPARPIGHRNPSLARANPTMLKPEVHEFRAHDMNVTIRLNLLGWQLATFNIDLDMGKFADDTPTRRTIDGACKRLSRRWVNAMTS
jgi:hypothetical protein